MRDKVEVRRAGGEVPQGAIVLSDLESIPQLAILGSLSFSTDGLGITPGSPLSFIQATETVEETRQLSLWFDAQWAGLRQNPSHQSAVIVVLQAMAEHRDPFQVYTLILHHLFRDRGEGFFRQADREESLIHLLRVNVLKRMESSVTSFGLTVQRQLRDVEATVAPIEANAEELEELDIADVDIEDPAFESLLVGRKVKVLVKDVDRIRWKQDLIEDRNRLATLHAAAQQDPDGNPVKGDYARIFEEAYRRLSRSPDYRSRFEEVDFGHPAEEVHEGCFSIDKKGGWSDTAETNQASRKYQRIVDEHYFAQQLFAEEELTGYLRNRLVDMKKSIYENVVYDSDTERTFAH